MLHSWDVSYSGGLQISRWFLYVLNCNLWSICLIGCQALLGQKYGYRPFPPTIDADEFCAIRTELASAAAAGADDADEQDAVSTRQASLQLLDTWFKRNTNVIPAIYTLQPISSVLPDYAMDSVIWSCSLTRFDWYQILSHFFTLIHTWLWNSKI